MMKAQLPQGHTHTHALLIKHAMGRGRGLAHLQTCDTNMLRCKYRVQAKYRLRLKEAEVDAHLTSSYRTPSRLTTRPQPLNSTCQV